MQHLKRSLGFSTTTAIVIGGIIGSGIFMKPAVMANQLGSAPLLITVWIVAGLITLFGALSNAEVAGMFPETGGQYVFFNKMYGPFFSFLYGWSAFAVFNTAGTASIAFLCAEYANYFLHLPRLNESVESSVFLPLPGIGKVYPLQNLGVKALTTAFILVFTWINYRSVLFGATAQRMLTAIKLIAIFLLIAGLFGSDKGSLAHVTQTTGLPEGIWAISGFMAAIGGAFWAYDGWNNITFIAGEIKQPQQTIPRSLMLSMFVCIATYVSVNMAFLYVLPVNEMASSRFVASEAAAVAWGFAGGTVIAILVVLTTLGTSNSNVLATARVTLAWCRESNLSSRAGKVHSRNNTPGNALLINAGWTILLIFSGSFDMLTDMLIFVSWFFYMMSGIGLFVIRYKFPDHERPYRVWGYPMVPGIFIIFAATFLFVTLYNDIGAYLDGKSNFINSVFGIVITAAGIPLYFMTKYRNSRPNTSGN